MPVVKHYLEFSEPDGSHKFYEVVVDDANMTIRYGRIGDAGQSKTSALGSHEKALAEALKKVAEKKKKGYEDAVQGARKKRKVTERGFDEEPVEATPTKKKKATATAATTATTTATRNAPTANAAATWSSGQIPSSVYASPFAAKSGNDRAPLLWRFKTNQRAFGIAITDDRCWIGNQQGSVYALSHEGVAQEQFRLPDGVKCLVADGHWLYAGCDDGNVYDLTGKVPRVAYEISDDIDIYWIDIKDGILGVSDADGYITVVNHEDESQWRTKSNGTRGWMVRCDELGVYHGYLSGVTMYDWDDGRKLWSIDTPGAVLFGWQEETRLYVATSRQQVLSISKRQGGDVRICQCDATVYSCATADEGKYIFAGDNVGGLYCFDENGVRQWKLHTNCGAALSMQYFKGRLYFVTNDGSLACMDVSEQAINDAKKGTVPTMQSFNAPTPVAAADSRHLNTVAASSIQASSANTGTGAATSTASGTASGIVVSCIEENGKLRVIPVGAGYKAGWHVQFPKNIRVAGARYLVTALVEADGFYRVRGDISRIL